jgi:sarcosine oxidase subunit gamma
MTSRSPLSGLLLPGRHGRKGRAGVTIADASSRAILLAAGETFPRAPGCVRSGAGLLVTVTPGQALWIGDSLLAAPPAGLSSAGHLTDLTGSRAILRIAGPRWRDVVSAFVPLDIHPTVFPEGAAAATLGAHLSLTLWRPPGLDGLEIAAYRSFAGALVHAVTTAAAAVGYDVIPATVERVLPARA